MGSDNLKKTKSDEVVVHILRAGKALCGFSVVKPLEWPAGHLFVAELNWEVANCAECTGRKVRLNQSK